MARSGTALVVHLTVFCTQDIWNRHCHVVVPKPAVARSHKSQPHARHNGQDLPGLCRGESFISLVISFNTDLLLCRSLFITLLDGLCDMCWFDGEQFLKLALALCLLFLLPW